MRVWKHEWHIYSSLFITCSLMFIVIHCTSGNAQILGASMAPIVGGAFAISENWKKTPAIVHQWAMVISLVSVLGFVIFKKIDK